MHPRTAIAVTTLAALIALLGSAGCQKPFTEPAIGFIPASVPMKRSADDSQAQVWRAPGLNMAAYSSVKVEPVMPVPGGDYELSPEDLQKLCGMLQAQLDRTFANWIMTGDKPLVVRASITAVRPNNPVRNVLPQTQIRKRGYGYAACEMYATDGPGGAVVAAYMETTDTQRFSLEKLTPLGTAQAAIDEWVESFASVVRTGK